MAKFIRGVIFWPLTIVAIMMAIANRAPVQLSFDPFNPETPAFAVTLPVFLVLLIGALIGIVLGGLSAWADQSHWRQAARGYQKRLQALEAQLQVRGTSMAPRPSTSTALTPIHTA